MAKTKQRSKVEIYREVAQIFTVAASLSYALFAAIRTLTNSPNTGSTKVIGNIILIGLMAGGLTMGLLYVVSDKKK